MQFTIASILALGAIMANAAAVPSPAPNAELQTPHHLLGRAVLTATNAYAACNKPNNGNHKEGDSCAYYGGVSDSSTIVYGKCTLIGGSLTCE